MTSALSDYAVVAEQIKVGKLHALATTSSERVESLPDVPTVTEWAGFMKVNDTPAASGSLSDILPFRRPTGR